MFVIAVFHMFIKNIILGRSKNHPVNSLYKVW